MALKLRSTLRLACAALALGVCGAATARASDAPPPTATAASAPRTWTLGTLELTACELSSPTAGSSSTAAWCSDFEVPENRADPDGRHIKLKLAVIRSDAIDAARSDMVVLLAGGPGEAATQSFMNTSWYGDLLARRHVLLIDQRGTGASNPLSCKKAGAAHGEDSDLATLDLDRLRAQVSACLAEVRENADPRYYTTTIAVEDLEAARQALGAPMFNLIGVSYGTRVAQQYLMRHPDAVRSVVLDSPVPNSLLLGAGFARNLDDALERQFANCTADAKCKERFGDPMHTLQQLRDALRANPHKVSFRHPLSYKETERMLSDYTLAGVVRMFAYAPETAALLPLSIDAAAHGDVGPLLGQAELLSSNFGESMNGGMAMSVICSEDADHLAENPADEDTILGNSLVKVIKTQCAIWPHGEMPDDFHAHVASDIPTLILSGELDPVTPPAYGAEILEHLANARHLVGKGQGHGMMVRGCTPKLINEFIERIDPAGLKAECLDRLGPTPAFITFNGAAP